MTSIDVTAPSTLPPVHLLLRDAEVRFRWCNVLICVPCVAFCSGGSAGCWQLVPTVVPAVTRSLCALDCPAVSGSGLHPHVAVRTPTLLSLHCLPILCVHLR
jgi:hypothetical protein